MPAAAGRQIIVWHGSCVAHNPRSTGCRASQQQLQGVWTRLVQAWREARAEQEREQHEAAQLFRVKSRPAESEQVSLCSRGHTGA